MKQENILRYYDYLTRLAESKCNSQSDAEDLVHDTMLAAFAYIHKGGEIEYPKTWLTNTFYHKYNDILRKKYHSPVTVCLDEGIAISYEDDNDYLSSEEASNVRKELNHIANITREVLIRFYYGNQSVSDIANGLNIPEGTVKSRLSAGRSQIKKGLETMEERENYLPGKLWLSYGGGDGQKGEPISLVENDLIAQNLLILAYDKPVTASELSKMIDIPCAYIEPIIKKLVDGELIIKTNGDKYYSDFIIRKPEDFLQKFQPQLDFAHEHFDTIWEIISELSGKLLNLNFVKNMTLHQQTKLDRYAILKALQDFEHFGTDMFSVPEFPARRDGGHWFAQACAIPADCNKEKVNETNQYVISGGHRSTENATQIGKVKALYLFEFDTTLWDSPYRYAFFGGLRNYYKFIHTLLWCIYEKLPIDSTDIPNNVIEYIPRLEEVGLLCSKNGEIEVDIPVLSKAEYDIIINLINDATKQIKTELGAEYTMFIKGNKTKLPKHLTSVPELFKYIDASKYIVMAVIREAYEKGLHLKNVDYCCPPVVLVYKE